MQEAVSAFRSESPSVASDEERGRGAGHEKEEEEEEEAETTFLIGRSDRMMTSEHSHS
jgi:hypothetical protein